MVYKYATILSDALETNMCSYEKQNLYAFLNVTKKVFWSSSDLADKSAKLRKQLRVTKFSKNRLESL